MCTCICFKNRGKKKQLCERLTGRLWINITTNIILYHPIQSQKKKRKKKKKSYHSINRVIEHLEEIKQLKDDQINFFLK